MNPDQSSRDEIEMKLTALLLGELPADEAKLLRYTISQDAGLQKLHDELAQTIVLVREVEKAPASAPAENAAPLKLSEDRRAKLLAQFKMPRKADPLSWLKRIDVSRIQTPRLLTVLAVLAIVAVLAAMMLPSLAAAKKKAQRVTMLNGEQMDKAKAQAAPSDLQNRTWSGDNSDRYETAVSAAPVSAPATISAEAKPALAPVPASPIVLPAAEAPQLIDPATGLPSADRKAGLFSQSAFSYENKALAAKSLPGQKTKEVALGISGTANSSAVDQLATRDRAEIVVVNSFGGAGGGGGGAGGPPVASDTRLAWFGSSVNRSAGENGPANLGEEFRRSVPEGRGGTMAGFDLATAAPQEKLPISTGSGAVSANFEVTKSKAENFDQLLTGGLHDGDSLAVGNKFYRQPARERSDINVSIAPGAAAPAKPVASTDTFYFATDDLAKRSEDPKLPAISSGGALALADIPKDAFQAGLAKEDVGGLRYVTDSDEKHKLAQMEEVQKILDSRIKAVRIDASLPTYTMVEITTPAEPNKTQSFWQGLKGEYSSVAQVKVENEGAIIAGINGAPSAQQLPYDPYFVQTTFEIIKSEKVLGKVVDALKLDSAWADGGQKLTRMQAVERLKSRLDLEPVRNSKLISIGATGGKPEEAAKIANAVAEAYAAYRAENKRQIITSSLDVLQKQYAEEDKKIRELRSKIESAEPKPIVEPADKPLPKPAPNAAIPQPEILTRENNFSTFSLNVSDVSFKLAAASLEKGQLPDAASIRSEEFINAFDYRDPEAAAGQPLAFVSERAAYPFAQNRDLLRFSVKTAAAGRAAGRPLNLVLLLDNSGSMERADRVAIIREALRVLGTQLQPQDKVSVVTFARTARLWADGVSGDKAGETLKNIGGLTPEGGTNLEEAMRLAYETAHRHYAANGMNRVVLLTDGAANLGDVNPADLKQKVEAQRKQGIALDCFGIGQEDYNDDLLEQLSRNGDGRYAFLNSPEEVNKEFAAKLAGALQIAASDVKVQVEFNPQRVISYRQIGYAKHQLTKQQFRDNTVDAAEIAAQEAGNALYTVETKADGVGPIATVRVRYKVPGTTDYRERSWEVPYAGSAVSLDQSSAAMRLAATASAFSEWLAASPLAQEVTPDELLKTMSGVTQIYGADQRPQKLEWMIRQAKSMAGK